MRSISVRTISDASPSDPLVNEQPALPADAAAVSGKTSISADDPVARNHNGNRVCGIGQANRTDRFRAAQLSRQRPITQRGAGLDRPECRPNFALKRGASGCDGNRIDRAEVAQEVIADRPPNCRGCGAVLYSEAISFRAIMQPKKTPHARLEVVKVQSAHMSFAIMNEKQCSDRALEAICVQGLRRYWGSHGTTLAGLCHGDNDVIPTNTAIAWRANSTMLKRGAQNVIVVRNPKTASSPTVWLVCCGF